MNKLVQHGKALVYAEQNGILRYEVKDGRMVYYTNYPLEHKTYKCIINLGIMKETRVSLKRYCIRGDYNLCV
jgi:hypothetical protein